MEQPVREFTFSALPVFFFDIRHNSRSPAPSGIPSRAEGGCL
jgi:hypothetical protein